MDYNESAAHITHRVLQAFQQHRFRVAVIPGGCTQYLQNVDIFYAAAVKRLIFERYTQCHTVNFSASLEQQRNNMTNWVHSAHNYIVTNYNVHETFTHLGYYNINDIKLMASFNYQLPNMEEVKEEVIQQPQQKRAGVGQKMSQASLLAFLPKKS